MTLPGMQPHPLVGVPIIVPPTAAYVLNGSNKGMKRTLSTSAPGTLRFTYSMWVKPISWVNTWASLFITINNPTDSEWLAGGLSDNGDSFGLNQVGGIEWNEYANSLTPDIALGAWHHLLFRVDTSLGTAADRARLYLNGTQVPDDAWDTPSASQAHILFKNGLVHQIGMDETSPDFTNAKLAFIDCVDGLGLPPTDFAFNNAGTWTRKLYAGSYGTYGFKLDGSDGFNDTSGNAQHFSGHNMTGADISSADMPPFTN